MGLEGIYAIVTASVGLIISLFILMGISAFITKGSDYLIAIAEWYDGHMENAFAQSTHRRMEILNKVLGRK